MYRACRSLEHLVVSFVKEECGLGSSNTINSSDVQISNVQFSRHSKALITPRLSFSSRLSSLSSPKNPHSASFLNGLYEDVRGGPTPTARNVQGLKLWSTETIPLLNLLLTLHLRKYAIPQSTYHLGCLPVYLPTICPKIQTHLTPKCHHNIHPNPEFESFKAGFTFAMEHLLESCKTPSSCITDFLLGDGDFPHICEMQFRA